MRSLRTAASQARKCWIVEGLVIKSTEDVTRGLGQWHDCSQPTDRMEPHLFHVATFYKLAVETCAAIQQCRRIPRAPLLATQLTGQKRLRFDVPKHLLALL
jgi:hypothetical protein